MFTADLVGLRRCQQLDGEREFQGVRYPMHRYDWGAWRIWGATARMVFQLLEQLPEPTPR